MGSSALRGLVAAVRQEMVGRVIAPGRHSRNFPAALDNRYQSLIVSTTAHYTGRIILGTGIGVTRRIEINQPFDLATSRTIGQAFRWCPLGNGWYSGLLKQWLVHLRQTPEGLEYRVGGPDGDIRRLRSYLRQRTMLVQYASHHIQHMQKALTQMNVKLQHVIRDITGKTSMDIVEAIVDGERDPRKLVRLRVPRIKADEATIVRSLQGHWRGEHIFELTQALELYRAYQSKIAECDRKIEAQLERFEDRSDGGPPAPNSKKRTQKNAPRFDVQIHLYRMTGVDLTRIDGVDGFTALKVISEIGTDMTKWESAGHFASWLGLSPNNRVTGGKVISSKTKPSANRAVAALRLAANALHRSDSALGAFLHRKKAHLGAPQAITAPAHKLAVPHHLFHAAVRPGVRGCWRRILLVPFPLEDALYRISVHLLIIPTQSGIQS